MDDEKIVFTANAILAQLTVPRRVKTIADLNADMFVTMYEGLCGEPIPDLVLPTTCEEDEVHNMQCVIDSLAMDVLHTSLAHIVGQDVVQGRRMSVMNLLDIFSGLLEYILDGIEKEETTSESSREASTGLDAADQSILSAAVQSKLKDKTNFTKNGETVEGFASSHVLSSPTASPNHKKSRRTGERRRSKKATPTPISQPIASSSMQSINPSCTESDSDAPAKPVGSKVPDRCSPTAPSKAAGNDATFIKPFMPPERSIAHKLADEILKTGESTDELIALANTPVTRPKTRSTTKLSNSAEKDIDKKSNEVDQMKNTQRPRGSKQVRQAKRHVSFVSDRTLNNDDTLADVPSHIDESRGLSGQSPPLLQASSHKRDERQNMSDRLVDYFDGKVAHENPDSAANQYQTATEFSAPVHSSEFQTAIEKSASLYERVKALRNAATDKLESLKSDSVVDGDVGELSTTEYYLPTSADSKPSSHANIGGDSADPSVSSLYLTATDAGPTSRVLRGSCTNTGLSNGRTDTATGFLTARQQTNVTGLGDRPSDTLTASPATRITEPIPFTTTADSHSSRHTALREPSISTYVTAHDPSISTYVTGRDPNASSYVTGSEPTTSTYKTCRGVSVDGVRKGHRSESVLREASQEDSSILSDSTKPGGRGVRDETTGMYRTRAAQAIATDRLQVDNSSSSRRPLRFILDTQNSTTKNRSELIGYKRPNWKSKLSGVKPKDKQVHFSRSSAGGKRKTKSVVEAVRKTLDEEKWKEKLQEKMLSKQYREDLSDMVDAHRDRLEEEKSEVIKQDKQFASNVQKLADAYGDKPTKSKRPSNPKGFLLPKSRIIKKRPPRTSSSAAAVPSDSVQALDPDDENFLPNLMDEFPHLYLAPETIQKMWTNHQQQSATVSKCMEAEKRKKSKAQATIEDAEKRQALLMNIMQKELEHTRRIKDMREKENAEIESKRKERDVRVQSARVKKYYDEYSTRMKASMLKNKTKEEQLFKRLFAEGLRVQKERMQVLRVYAREQREKRAQKQAVDVESLENFYKDQFGMLAESVSQERKNVEIRDAAQAEVLNKMKMELRRKMERDIKDFQEQLKRDDDDYYFRQLDAEKVVQQLNMTRYQTGL
ncbi:apical junction molecule-like [Watersipora subatra]|uniref:apical junction molecule-like n=1 Tax=Watersipora subatra TaxID=2589382 RepID=UPI00355C648B